jgi:hypothetical protein
MSPSPGRYYAMKLVNCTVSLLAIRERGREDADCCVFSQDKIKCKDFLKIIMILLAPELRLITQKTLQHATLRCRSVCESQRNKAEVQDWNLHHLMNWCDRRSVGQSSSKFWIIIILYYKQTNKQTELKPQTKSFHTTHFYTTKHVHEKTEQYYIGSV